MPRGQKVQLTRNRALSTHEIAQISVRIAMAAQDKDGPNITQLAKMFRCDRNVIRRIRDADAAGVAPREPREPVGLPVGVKKRVLKRQQQVLALTRRKKTTTVSWIVNLGKSNQMTHKRKFVTQMFSTARAIVGGLAAKGINVCPQTVRTDLAALGFAKRTRKFVVSVDPRLPGLRMAWAKERLRRLLIEIYFWSDESYINCTVDDSQPWEYRRRGEEGCPRHAGRPQKDEKVMMWVIIGPNGANRIVIYPVGQTMTGAMYVADALEPSKRAVESDPNHVFYHDGAGVHTSIVVKDWFRAHPAFHHQLAVPYTPMANLSEMVWALMKPRVSRHHPTRDNLVDTIMKVWKDEVTRDELDNIRGSLRKQCETIIRLEGNV